jgi:hypothetical protein
MDLVKDFDPAYPSHSEDTDESPVEEDVSVPSSVANRAWQQRTNTPQVC